MGTVSYKAQIMNAFHILDGTVDYYRDVITYITEVVLAHYDELAAIEGVIASHLRQVEIESLIHTTKTNTAAYKEFDRRFYKFPCYLRRDAIKTAYALVDSWKKLLALWEKDGCKGKRPRLNRSQASMPCFYRGNAFVKHADDHLFYKKDEDTFMLKVWHNHDWVWIPVVLRETDLRYIKDHCLPLKEHAPVLVKKHRKYYLQFAYDVASKDVPKYKKDKDVESVLGVDLGVNTDAVCSVLHKDGTVTGRKFINHPVEKDRLYKDLHAISKAQSNGARRCPRLWRFVDNYGDAIAIDTARRIVEYAVKKEVDVIVFEHLSITGKIKGSKAQRITLWRKREIQHRVETMAERHGIRVSYVFAPGTSKYAFDGSGEVVRDKDNHKLCTFAGGKRYNCDLSASYNIGARFFIRVLLKTLSEKARLSMEAKVPSMCKRTTCTLSTLISLCTELSGSPDDAETGCTGGRAVPAA